MNPRTLTKILTTADDDGICASQTPAGAGNLTINGAFASGGVATLDTQRRVLLTFAGNETGHTFVVYGTKQGGSAISETVAGTTIGTVATNLDFLTVTRVSISAAASGAIKVGTNGVGATDWIIVDTMRNPVNFQFQCVVSGTVTYTVQYTSYNVNALPSGVVYPVPFNHPTVVTKSDNQAASFTDAVCFIRLQINSGTGSVAFTYAQAGP